jgi:hypothetical protein
MVPDEADGTAVQLAKKLCADCPVRAACLLEAEEVAERFGPELVQGVWGGLTGQERNTMVGLNRAPAPCSRCGLDCVPISPKLTECEACSPRSRLRYDDYQTQITALIAAGCSYEQIALRLRLTKSGVVTACARWKLTPQARSSSVRKAHLPCGTVAAKYRHHREEKYSWKRCPQCREVPWKPTLKK